MKGPKLKAPFPYFGGKRRVAHLVWPRVGDVANLIIPFFGSGGEFWGGIPWLFERPDRHRIATVNDADCYVANFWRAIQADPDAVAEHADWPVNETDLHARHRWLVLSDTAAEFRQRMRTDPQHFDALIAGWWCWGLCCWIGGGWCSATGGTADGDRQERRAILSQDGMGLTCKSSSEQLPDLSGRGVHASAGLSQQVPGMIGGAGARGVNGAKSPEEWNQRPALHETGNGVHAKRPSLGDANRGDGAKGVHSKRPILAARSERDIGKGVNSINSETSPLSQKKPLLNAGGNCVETPGRGVNGLVSGTCAQRRAWLQSWFADLADYLRTVRVCCGAWQRVCDSTSVTTRLGLTGIFFDPPYSLDVARMHAWVAHLLDAADPPEAGSRSENRDGNLYATDADADVDLLVARVQAYCRQRGDDPLMRIVLCGYAGEHDALEALGWSVIAWRAHGGYGNRSSKGRSNAGRERIWFSPHCLRPEIDELPLFQGMA